MKSLQDAISKKPWLGWALFFSTLIVVFLIGLLASSIIERRSESFAVQQVKPLPDWEPRNEKWGENYPREYETYLKTLDTNFASKYAGSKSHDVLAEHPELPVLWAGYAFSKDYNQARGHAYAITDIYNTLRTGGAEQSPQPGTCWTCKSTDVPRVMSEMGVANFYKTKWKDLGGQIVNPIGCQDCHDPKTMRLRITRPALIEAMERRGKKMEDFTQNEMRSLVCAQCHVEYYFKGKEDKYLTFPWDKGFSADDMEAYYDSLGHVDFVNAISRTPILKAQHPDYEIYMTGIHAARGVTCADCHMPYKIEGGVKFSDHHVQSPLNNIANSCQVCHRQSEEQLKKDVYFRQDRTLEMLRLVEKALAAAHIEAKTAWDNGATEQEMQPVLKLIRSAQWRWDWVAASNGLGFHSPVEVLRTLGTSLQRAEQSRGALAVVLSQHGVKLPIIYPDISTKEKAQAYIGLDLKALKADKAELIKNYIPQWREQAVKRQGGALKIYQ